MATTKIWDVRAHVSKLIAYVANKNKTTMEFENKNFDEVERLAAEILGLPYDHFATEEKKFVTGINCTPDNANELMMTLLEDTDKDDIQAYHGDQSFKPNEVIPDVAHAIGVQLANELWGEDIYERSTAVARTVEQIEFPKPPEKAKQQTRNHGWGLR